MHAVCVLSNHWHAVLTDPDGNPLELHCRDYPDHENLPAGPYDKKLTIHDAPWPPAELADEADRLMEASLERMRARQKLFEIERPISIVVIQRPCR